MESSRRAYLKALGVLSGGVLAGSAADDVIGGSRSSDGSSDDELQVMARFLPEGKNQFGFNSGQNLWTTDVEDDYINQVVLDGVYDDILTGFGKFIGFDESEVVIQDLENSSSVVISSPEESEISEGIIHRDSVFALDDGNLSSVGEESLNFVGGSVQNAVSESDLLITSGSDTVGFTDSDGEYYEAQGLSSRIGDLMPETLCVDDDRGFLMNRNGDLYEFELPELEGSEVDLQFDAISSFDNVENLSAEDGYIFLEAENGFAVYDRESGSLLDHGFLSELDAVSYREGKLLTYSGNNILEKEVDTGKVLEEFKVQGVEDLYGAGDKAVVVKENGSEFIDLDSGTREELDSRVRYADQDYRVREKNGRTFIDSSIPEPEVFDGGDGVYIRNNQDRDLLLAWEVDGYLEDQGVRHVESGKSFKVLESGADI